MQKHNPFLIVLIYNVDTLIFKFFYYKIPIIYVVDGVISLLTNIEITIPSNVSIILLVAKIRDHYKHEL